MSKWSTAEDEILLDILGPVEGPVTKVLCQKVLNALEAADFNDRSVSGVAKRYKRLVRKSAGSNHSNDDEEGDDSTDDDVQQLSGADDDEEEESEVEIMVAPKTAPPTPPKPVKSSKPPAAPSTAVSPSNKQVKPPASPAATAPAPSLKRKAPEMDKREIYAELKKFKELYLEYKQAYISEAGENVILNKRIDAREADYQKLRKEYQKIQSAASLTQMHLKH